MSSGAKQYKAIGVSVGDHSNPGPPPALSGLRAHLTIGRRVETDRQSRE